MDWQCIIKLCYIRQIKDQFHNDNFASRAVMARDHEFDSEFRNTMMKQMVSIHKRLSFDIFK